MSDKEGGATAAFLTAFDVLPTGTFQGRFRGLRWIVTRSSFADGRSEKLVGEAVDGSDYISLNLYRLAEGIRLAPCEMSEAKVRAFVLGLVPEDGAPSSN
ncbi:MAG: hypothetical protein AAFU80_05345 [Pseudomonadota bacterium]